MKFIWTEPESDYIRLAPYREVIRLKFELVPYADKK